MKSMRAWLRPHWRTSTTARAGKGLERGDPRYMLGLIRRVVTVGVRTVEIVAGLPSLKETTARLGVAEGAAAEGR